jgi:hypothetical protein
MGNNMKASLTRGSIRQARRIMNNQSSGNFVRSGRDLATIMKRANHRLTRRLWKRESGNEDGWHTIASNVHSWQIF